jgi:hypothetical protein
MELLAILKRVIGPDVHRAQITACAIIEEPDGTARAGLLRGSFVPPSKLRELRLISRQRQKLVGQLSSEKNCSMRCKASSPTAIASFSTN